MGHEAAHTVALIFELDAGSLVNPVFQMNTLGTIRHSARRDLDNGGIASGNLFGPDAGYGDQAALDQVLNPLLHVLPSGRPQGVIEGIAALVVIKELVGRDDHDIAVQFVGFDEIEPNTPLRVPRESPAGRCARFLPPGSPAYLHNLCQGAPCA